MKFSLITLRFVIFITLTFLVTAVSVVVLVDKRLVDLIDETQSLIYNERLHAIEHHFLELRNLDSNLADNNENTETLLYEFQQKYCCSEIQKSHPFILDLTGRIVYHKTLGREDGYFIQSEFFKKAMTVKDGQFTVLENGQKYWYSIKYIQNYDWLVIYKVPFSVKYAEVSQMRSRLIVMVLGISLFAGIILSLVIVRTTKPILELARLSSRMSEGELDIPIEVYRNDEIGILAGSIRKMRDNTKGKMELLAKAISEAQAENTRGSAVQAELYKANQMLEIVLETVPMSIFWKDLDSVYLGANTRFSRDAGFECPRELVGKTDFDLCWSSEAELYRADDAQVMKTGTPCIGYEEPQTTPDGKTIWLRTNKTPLRKPDGTIVGVLGTYEDITKQKVIESEREKLLRDLGAKNEELESVVYTASHDLRSPLVNIEGFSAELGDACKKLNEILKDIDLSPEQKRKLAFILEEEIPTDLDFIRTSSNKMDRLMSGLLRLSRLGRASLEIQPVDIDVMINNVLKTMQHQISRNQVKLQVDKLPDCLGDQTQLMQVFTNLIDNSIKYLSPNRSGKIHISGWIQADDAIYCVTDNGIGIAPDHKQKVFEIFHRLEPDSDIRGEGLGLTIVRRIVDRHSGSIWIESDPGWGTTVYVSLPKT